MPDEPIAEPEISRGSNAMLGPTGSIPVSFAFANGMIALDLQTFDQSRQSGNVTGVIFLESQGRAFPERGWSDFPVIILGWWIDAWLQLEVPTRREVQWPFRV